MHQRCVQHEAQRWLLFLQIGADAEVTCVSTHLHAPRGPIGGQWAIDWSSLCIVQAADPSRGTQLAGHWALSLLRVGKKRHELA